MVVPCGAPYCYIGQHALQNLVSNVPINVNDGLRKLADDFTRAFQQTQWGVNGRVQPRFFDDSFVFRASMLESGRKKTQLAILCMFEDWHGSEYD